MPMKCKGLVKLVEELGELTQVAAKRIAYPRGKHPDEYREAPLNERIEDEISDVVAAIRFVTSKLKLNQPRMRTRVAMKLKRFQRFDRK